MILIFQEKLFKKSWIHVVHESRVTQISLKVSNKEEIDFQKINFPIAYIQNWLMPYILCWSFSETICFRSLNFKWNFHFSSSSLNTLNTGVIFNLIFFGIKFLKCCEREIGFSKNISWVVMFNVSWNDL